MHKEAFEADIRGAMETLAAGGVILYPTDTVWGLGCDATNTEAVRKIFTIKQRPETKSMIVLVADERDILKYVAAADPEVFDFISGQTKPTTIIFDHAIGLAENLIAGDGSIAIRIVQDEFCRHLIKRFRKPIVSTSANTSGEPAPKIFKDIDQQLIQSADYVVNWRQDDEKISEPSQIIKWKGKGKYDVIRR